MNSLTFERLAKIKKKSAAFKSIDTQKRKFKHVTVLPTEHFTIHNVSTLQVDVGLVKV